MGNLAHSVRFRLSVTECTVFKSRKPKVDTYEYFSLFDAIEAFLSVPKRFQPTLTKIVDVDGVGTQVFNDLFSDNHHHIFKIDW